MTIAHKTVREIKKIFSSFGKEGEIFALSPALHEAALQSLTPGLARENWKKAILAEYQGKINNSLFKLCPLFLGELTIKSIEICHDVKPALARKYILDLLPIIIEHGKYVKNNNHNTIPHLAGFKMWLPTILNSGSLTALDTLLKGLKKEVGGEMLKFSIDGLSGQFAFELLNKPASYPDKTAIKAFPILTNLIKKYGHRNAHNMDYHIYLAAFAYLLPNMMSHGQVKKRLSAPFICLMGHMMAQHPMTDLSTEALLSLVQPESQLTLKNLVAQQGVSIFLKRLNRWAEDEKKWQTEWKKESKKMLTIQDKPMAELIDSALFYIWQQPEHQLFPWSLNDYPELKKIVKISDKIICLYQLQKTLILAKNPPKLKI